MTDAAKYGTALAIITILSFFVIYLVAAHAESNTMPPPPPNCTTTCESQYNGKVHTCSTVCR